ncbi:hypothetical protein NQ176_g7914 [Zarea fungicola]|uniref:Uncharacterized protein n=1 Tax=Zarea fungicola TaxID=93591 RepID=A0ACC1MWU1_9HYPO|nr:hypothetical protein NQ176_g7914 [Lecanicillium fungicola]
MKFVLISVLALQTAVAVAAPNLFQPLFRRDNGSSDAVQQLTSGFAKVAACFDIALDKAGVKKEGTVVPKPPKGLDCEAVISFVNKPHGTGSSSKPSETHSSAAPSSTGSMSSKPSDSASSTDSSSSSKPTSTTSGGSSSAATSDAPSTSGGSSSTSTSTSEKPSSTDSK